MTRFTDDPTAAADALIADALDDIGLDGRVLIANQHGRLHRVLGERHVHSVVWNRRTITAAAAAAEPPPGPFDLALVRLPKGRGEQAMTSHQVLGVLQPGARVILYGGNDEGIRPAARVLGEIAGPVETLAARGHGRIVAATRAGHIEGLKPALAGWRTLSQIEIAGMGRTWVGYPGLFADSGLDAGTALLLAALPLPGGGQRVLDYGCGSGVVAAALLHREPALSLDMLDNDTVALAAAAENVPGARTILGRDLAAAGAARYDLIVSNPPLHAGLKEDHAALEQLIRDAPQSLVKTGRLVLVVQRRVALERLLAGVFATVQTLADDGRYRVWSSGLTPAT